MWPHLHLWLEVQQQCWEPPLWWQFSVLCKQPPNACNSFICWSPWWSLANLLRGVTPTERMTPSPTNSSSTETWAGCPLGCLIYWCCWGSLVMLNMSPTLKTKTLHPHRNCQINFCLENTKTATIVSKCCTKRVNVKRIESLCCHCMGQIQTNWGDEKINKIKRFEFLNH